MNLLHEKADRLQGRAQEFHDMIRKHNQREAAKKWWSAQRGKEMIDVTVPLEWARGGTQDILVV